MSAAFNVCCPRAGGRVVQQQLMGKMNLTTGSHLCSLSNKHGARLAVASEGNSFPFWKGRGAVRSQHSGAGKNISAAETGFLKEIAEGQG